MQSSSQNLINKIILGINMRNLIDEKLRVAKFTIEELIGKHKTRDDIDKLILGFNNILQNPKLLDSILKKLDENLRLSSTM